MNKLGIIYVITNKINKKQYVGQTTKSLNQRWAGHRTQSKNIEDKYPLYLAARKYGWDNFTVEILFKDVPIVDINYWEEFWIREKDSYNSGYNATLGGGGIRGHKHSEETKRKISEAHVGRVQSIEHIEKNRIANSGKNNPMYGRKHSAEAIAKQKLAKSQNKDKTTENCIRNSLRMCKTYKIIKPDGTEEIITNLAKYCRENGLNNSIMVCVARKRKNFKSHKDFKIEYFKEENICMPK